ncbi:hypothetical protein [Bosea sp. MMO-172]|uniref:hypothetical protein n=1 Tax=Bosea sp. MMO-172 TaxID=3127885 RepID=UPI0030179A73
MLKKRPQKSIESAMPSHLINSIKIKNLFGLYSYDLPHEGSLADASILYGDNGVGKSTILKLVFHLLSPGGNNGHRTALLEANFSYLEVILTTGIKVSATKKSNDENNSIVLQINDENKILAIWEHHVDHVRFEDGNNTVLYLNNEGKIISRRRINQKAGPRPPEGEEAFLEALQRHSPTVFILNA